MSDTTRSPDSTVTSPRGEDGVARLLALAGARPELSAERASRLQAAVRPAWQDAAAAHRRRRFMRRSAFALAAAAMIGAVVISRWSGPPVSPRPSGTPFATVVAATAPLSLFAAESPEAPQFVSLGHELRAGNLLTTGDARAALHLVSGASIRLDAGSEVRWLSPSRIELMAGTVYVESASGADAGVEIVTALGAVREIGTQFEVRLLAAELRVRVREGSVVLQQNENAFEAGHGEQLIATAGQQPEKSSISSYGPSWSWILDIAPPFDLDGKSLAEYLDWISRELGREVRFADPSLERIAADVGVYADLAGLDPEESLEVVLPSCGVRHRFADGRLIVEPAH